MVSIRRRYKIESSGKVELLRLADQAAETPRHGGEIRHLVGVEDVEERRERHHAGLLATLQPFAARLERLDLAILRGGDFDQRQHLLGEVFGRQVVGRPRCGLNCRYLHGGPLGCMVSPAEDLLWPRT